MSPHIIRLAKAVTITPRTDIEVVRLVEAVKADQPQIIRTMEEILELDPDTAITWRGTVIRTPEDAVNVAKIWTPHYILPAVVVATGEQVRAARKALEEA